MTKNKWKFGLLSVTAVLSLAGCNNTNVSDVDYTYNTYLSTSPSNWNVHNPISLHSQKWAFMTPF